MKTKKVNKRYEDLSDTITPLDYADWRGIGENKAREIFNSKGFPRLKGTGAKQVADKRAVRRYKQELKSKVQAVMLSTITFGTLIAGVIYNLI